MKHTFEEEFRLENPQWDFDNDILGPYTRWLEDQLLRARKQLALHNVVDKREQLAAFLKWYYENDECPDLVTYESAAERYLSR